MNAPFGSGTASTIDRIRHDLVGLRMPRALEALDHVVRRLEQGELSALEASRARWRDRPACIASRCSPGAAAPGSPRTDARRCRPAWRGGSPSTVHQECSQPSACRAPFDIVIDGGDIRRNSSATSWAICVCVSTGRSGQGRGRACAGGGGRELGDATRYRDRERTTIANHLLGGGGERGGQMARQWDQRSDADTQRFRGRSRTIRRGRPKVCHGSADRAASAVRQFHDDESRAAGRAHRHKHEPLPAKGVTRVCDRDLGYEPVDDEGMLRCSGLRGRCRLWQAWTWTAPLLGTTTSQLWRTATPGAGAIHTINRECLLQDQGAPAKRRPHGPFQTSGRPLPKPSPPSPPASARITSRPPDMNRNKGKMLERIL